MATAKFQFDADFGPTAGREALAAAVGEAEARGYRNGMAAAEAQARTEAERRSAMALERIAQLLQVMAANLAAMERKLEVEAVEVAAAVASKLAPALLAREPLAEIAELATSCFGELRNTPHVAVRVHASQHAAAQELLTKIAQAQGFEGRLIILGDEAIASGDCRLEWADGGVVRDSAATAALIEDAVARFVAGPGNGNSEG
ncbi:MAG TPA: FliH/SctL family protein [Xanthobacteraceae bacterium]|jgi:flagellar assembly protein FliH|nr:FliH/SctL family protein [Xanthobacteraceae bacterium]